MSSDPENSSESKGTWWGFAVRYGIGAVLAVFLLTSSLHFGYTPDETYVYLQYGKNIAQGEGFSFNAGSPSFGLPAPLWTLLVAAGSVLDLDPYVVAKTLDTVFAGFAVIAVLAFAFILIRDPVYALVAAWIFSFDAWFLRWSGSGLESSLAVLLVMLTLWYAYKKEYLTSSLVAGLLTLVRPEGVLLLAAVFLDIVLNGRDRKAVAKSIARSTLAYAVVVVPWVIFSALRLGDIVPNSIQLQPASPAAYLDNARSVVEIIGGTQLLAALFLIGGVVLAKSRLGGPALREDVFPLAWIAALPLACVIANVRIESRSLLLILPLVIIYGVWGIKRLEVASIVTSRGSLLILLLVACLSLAQNQYVYQKWILPHMENYQLGMDECLKPMAYWLRANTPASSKILTPDAGVVAYISGRETHDGTARFGPGLPARRDEYGYDYVIDCSAKPEGLASESLQPIMTRAFSGRSVRKPDLTYYTLYKVTK